MSHIHDWHDVGLWDNGTVVIPCRTPGCEAALYRDAMTNKESVQDGIFNCLGLDLRDDAHGGVTKIVCREIVTTYRLDKVRLADGAWMVDIGAHVGAVSIYMARRFPNARILAVEPHPENWARLCHNLAANHTLNVTPLAMAVTSDGRDVTLRGDIGLNSGGCSIYGDGDGLVVESTTLRGLLWQYGITHVALLKMDCEGAEYEIIESLPEMPADNLLSHTGMFVAEFHASESFAKQGRTPRALAKRVWRYIPQFNTRISVSG